jgi:hypothetical protein
MGGRLHAGYGTSPKFTCIVEGPKTLAVRLRIGASEEPRVKKKTLLTETTPVAKTLLAEWIDPVWESSRLRNLQSEGAIISKSHNYCIGSEHPKYNLG